MNLHVLITSVGYGDFLRATLPTTRRHFDAITILTARSDRETQRIATELRVGLHVTNAWHRRGAIFNKAAGINECLADIAKRNPDTWVLLLDADILLPETFHLDLGRLDSAAMYSAVRRICADQAEWEAFAAGSKRWTDFPVERPPVIRGRVWGTRPTSNPAGLTGYFQLWHLKNGTGAPRLPESINAGDYDVVFALSFAEVRRHYLPDIEVLHLGAPEKNWNGRLSSRWDSRATVAGPLQRLRATLQRWSIYRRIAWASLTGKAAQFAAGRESRRHFDESFQPARPSGLCTAPVGGDLDVATARSTAGIKGERRG